MSSENPFRTFDPGDDLSIVQRKLPHWSQVGTLCFITFRTNDSIPKAVLQSWQAKRRAWLSKHGIVWHAMDWRHAFAALPAPIRAQYHRTFSVKWHEHLDECYGECVLRNNDLAQIVADSLLHFDQQRYDLTDFVVMPNHVHLIAAFRDQASMLDQCESWKHYTAAQINRRLGRKGRFWQQDGFDHLLRSAEHFFRCRQYTAENPDKARLAPGEYLHYSRQLGK